MPPSSPRRSSLWPTNTSKASGSFCERFRGAALFSKSLVLFWTQLSFLRRLKTRAGFQPLRAPFSSAVKTASELAARKSSGQGKCGIGLRRGILAERLEASFFLNKNPRSHKRNGGSCLSEGNSSNGYSKSTFIENEPSFTFIRYSRGDIPKVSRKALEKWE